MRRNLQINFLVWDMPVYPVAGLPDSGAVDLAVAYALLRVLGKVSAGIELCTALVLALKLLPLPCSLAPQWSTQRSTLLHFYVIPRPRRVIIMNRCENTRFRTQTWMGVANVDD